jgi:uncharacterized membrane protein YgcG
MRGLWVLLAVALLATVAVAKVQIAVSRGKHNVGFLILISLVAIAVASQVVRRPRTALGDAVCKRIGELLARLRQKGHTISPHASGGELTYLAAAFGLGALPLTMAGLLEPLELRRRKANRGWSSCGSCGSTSASSCGSSSCGGSSCGGGGCGGGCGGCGG